MRFFNSHNEYGLLAKLFHWLTFIVLIAQVPFGFYLVGLEFSDERIELENIHILVGITVFYLTLFRLIWKFFNKSPSETKSFFKGQVIIGKANHFLLYVSIFSITISGILKKLYMGERLNFIFFKYAPLSLDLEKVFTKTCGSYYIKVNRNIFGTFFSTKGI